MLRSPRARATGAGALALVLAGCAGGHGGHGGIGDSDDDLESRVVSVLGLGSRAAADCPVVPDPEPGDRATCEVRDGEERLEVDIEFDDDGSIAVVHVVPG